MANSEPFFYFLIIPRDFLQERSYDWLSALKLFGHHTLIRKVFCQAVPYWGQGLRIRLELIRVWPSSKNRIQPLRKTRYRSDPNRMNFTIEICTKTILIFSIWYMCDINTLLYAQKHSNKSSILEGFWIWNFRPSPNSESC